MAKVDGGELLARTLERAGVKDVFALQGGHLDAFLVACEGHGIRLTDTRHEAAAGHAADGHDYIDDHPGVIQAVDEAFGEKITLYGSIWVHCRTDLEPAA